MPWFLTKALILNTFSGLIVLRIRATPCSCWYQSHVSELLNTRIDLLMIKHPCTAFEPALKSVTCSIYSSENFHCYVHSVLQKEIRRSHLFLNRRFSSRHWKFVQTPSLQGDLWNKVRVKLTKRVEVLIKRTIKRNTPYRLFGLSTKQLGKLSGS